MFDPIHAAKINELRNVLASFGRTDSESNLEWYLAINESGFPVNASDEFVDRTFPNMTELFREWPAACVNLGEPHEDWWEVWLVD